MSRNNVETECESNDATGVEEQELEQFPGDSGDHDDVNASLRHFSQQKRKVGPGTKQGNGPKMVSDLMVHISQE